MNLLPLSHWPQKLSLLIQELQECASGPEREDLAGEVWLLVRGALLIQLRREGPRMALRSEEAFEDLASDKALDLLRRAECGEWKADSRSPGEIVTYLRSVARNALVDRLRRQGKEVTPMNDDLSASAEFQDLQDPRAHSDSQAVGRESAEALKRCVESLGEKARRIWYLRVFLGLASKEISRHPGVRLKAGNVDVILQRSRRSVSECMQRKGFDTSELPVGSFSEMWRAMEEWGSMPDRKDSEEIS